MSIVALTSKGGENLLKLHIGKNIVAKILAVRNGTMEKKLRKIPK